MNTLSKRFFFGLIILSLLNSCSKESKLPNNITVSNIPVVDGPGNTFFNWETATTMPCDPSVNFNLRPSMPWSTQSGSSIDPGFLNDIKSADGWILVYNTFNNNTLPYPPLPSGGLYFGLYNKYRGLLRFYIYIPQGFMSNSVNIQHGLNVYNGGNQNTSMLNFNGSDLIDANINIQSFSKTNNIGVAFGGGWYAMQYEIAYDPNFAASSNLWLQWNSKAVNISDIKLNGTTTGSFTGAITQQVGPTSLTSLIQQGFTIAAEIYSLPSKFISNIFLKNLFDIGSKGILGQISGFLNGIFGGSSTNSQAINMTMNGTIDMKGTITSSTPLFPNTFNFPGQLSTQNIPINLGGALYNNPLGVFNLRERPIVNATAYTAISWSADGRRQTKIPSTKFTFATPNIVINPAVKSDANITLIKTDLIILNPNKGTNIFNDFIGGNPENIGTIPAWTNPLSFRGFPPFMFATTLTPTTNSTNIVLLRLIVKVTPNNGAPSSTIVKTFLANVIQA